MTLHQHLIGTQPRWLYISVMRIGLSSINCICRKTSLPRVANTGVHILRLEASFSRNNNLSTTAAQPLRTHHKSQTEYTKKIYERPKANFVRFDEPRCPCRLGRSPARDMMLADKSLGLCICVWSFSQQNPHYNSTHGSGCHVYPTPSSVTHRKSRSS